MYKYDKYLNKKNNKNWVTIVFYFMTGYILCTLIYKIKTNIQN